MRSPIFMWIAMACAACSSQPAPVPVAPTETPPPRAEAPPPRAETPPPGPPEAMPAPAPASCAEGYVESFEPEGDAAIACFTEGGHRTGCWRVEASGAATSLLVTEWPSSQESGEPRGDRTPAVENAEVYVRAPAGVTVTFDEAPYRDPAEIAVCEGGACKRFRLRPQKDELLNVLRLVTVLPDRHTVVVGLGPEPRGADALERYDLEKPGAAPLRIPIPLKRKCGELLDVLAGNWLLQASVCMNTGAQRLLTTPAGAVIADLGTYTADSPYFALGNNRWLFQSYDGLSIWDLARGKRVAFAKRSTDSIIHYIAVLGGKMIEVESEGTIVSWDASLVRHPLGAIPRCAP